MAPRRPTRAFDERAFHRWLATTLPAGRRPPRSLRDDVAAVPIPPGSVACLTTDALSEGTHFLRRSRARSIGAAAAGASLSDLASKGARPVAMLVDLLVPAATPIRWAQDVLAGAERACARFGAHVVGGDTKPAAGRSVVGTALGHRPRGPLPSREAARPGDVVVVTGTVGRGGLANLALRKRRPSVRELDALLRIEPRVAGGEALAPLVRSMTDTSDGIGDAARLISSASGVRVELNADRIPWEPRLQRLSLSPGERWSLGSFGGDYELFATARPSNLGRMEAAAARARLALTTIGRVTAGRGAWLRAGSGKPRAIRRGGWDPFAARPP